MKKVEWIWKEIFGTELLGLEEPRAGGWSGIGQSVLGQGVEDTAGVEAGDHPKDRELAEIQQCSQWKASTKKTDYRLGGSTVETLKAFQTFLVMAVEDILLRLVENLGGKATEKSGDTIEELDTEGGTRVAAVPFGKACWQDSPESTIVG